jgi:hypothetical protein
VRKVAVRGVDVKKLFLLVLILACSGCALLTPYAQWPNGKPVYPGAYAIEMQRAKDPNYHPSTVESVQRKIACSGPEMMSSCPGGGSGS